MRKLADYRILIPVGIALLPLLIYARSLGNDFVHWDDGLLILGNPWVRGLTWENIHHAFFSYDPELYIPLTLISYQATYAIAELQPFLYHLVNLLLHTANALLVFGIAWKLTKRMPAAVAAGLIFAIHPLHTEAVAWASARKDVLSTMFLFLTILYFLKYRETQKVKWYAWSIVNFTLGLLSKVSIITGAILLPGIDWLQGRIPFRRAVRDALPFAALSVIFGIISIFGKVTQSSFYVEKALIGAKATMFLLSRLVWPVGLTALYPYTNDIHVLNPDLLGSVIGVIVVTGLCVYACKWTRWPLFAWAVFLLFLVPSFANMAKGMNEALDVYVTSDRYAYAGSIGPIMLAGLGFDWLQRKYQMIGWTALAAVVVTFSGLAYVQSMTWHDSEEFFTHAIAVSPNAYIAHQNLGSIYVKRGDIDGGMREYAESLRIRPDAVTYYNLGQILEYQGNTEGAIEAYKEAVATSPLEGDAWVRLGVLLLQQGKTDEAEVALNNAAELDPKNAEIKKELEEIKNGILKK